MRSSALQHNAALVTIDIDDALSGTPPSYHAHTASARQPRKHFQHIAIAIDCAQDGKALAQQGTAHQIELDVALEMAEQLK